MSDDGIVMDVLKPPSYPELNLGDDLETRDELRERELEEARARAAQMEKTMRWWSDCTSNWREKWGKVRAERNKAREENRQLKLNLETSAKEISTLKREKQETIEGKMQLEREVEKLERELKKDKRLIPSARVEPSLKGHLDNVDGYSSVYDRTIPKPGAEQQFIEQILEKNDYYEASSLNSVPQDEWAPKSKTKVGHGNQHDVNNNQQVAVLQQKLQEMERLLSDERSSKANLVEEIECLQSDLTSLKLTNDDLKSNRTGNESEISRLKSRYEKEIDGLNADLEDVYSNSANVKKLKEMRVEIERLQTENALEWSKREKLETGKTGLERENKKLKHQVEDLESLLSHKTARASKIMDTDIKALQGQLDDKTAELADLRYAYNKIKKQHQEKTSELEHSTKRVDQHDAEVKKLRMRVEELKLDIARAEDETDVQINLVRKTQRSLDEQSERAESLQVQVQHLTSRLRNAKTVTVNTRKFSSRKAPLSLSSDEFDSDLD